VRSLVGMFSLVVWLVAAPTVVMAQMETLLVTVTFRERIALPPGARLDVQILDVAEVERQGGPIASQRFAMTAVPMTVSLTYDPQIVDGESRYGIVAAIRAPDGQQMFRATRTFGIPKGTDPAAVDLVLTMLTEDDNDSAVPRRISGVPWTVTEVFGQAWQNDDPPTLVIDDEMTFSIFGGCNRFFGQVLLSGRGLAFPGDFPGTMMACPDEVEVLERRFLSALRLVSDFVRYGAGLVMTDAQGRAVLHFVQTPE